MVGSTACAFGRAPGDEKALYVTTDGGFLIPHESGIQDAKLVRIEVGESGWPLLHVESQPGLRPEPKDKDGIAGGENIETNYVLDHAFLNRRGR
jgi:hypothetical protein